MMLPPLSGSATTAIDAVFEKVVLEIVQGVFPAGSRLPAERELARQLGASRPTLREALRRLGMWNLVEPRRGSGVVVRPYRDWSVEVLPTYLRHGKPQPGQPGLPQILADVLTVRRAVVIEVLRQTAGRIAAHATGPARRAAELAWQHRSDLLTHARYDFEIIRLLVEAAAFTPGLWVLNRVSTIWLDFVDAVRGWMQPAADYQEVHTRFFELLERGAGAEACATLEAFLLRQDEVLTRIAHGFERPAPIVEAR